MTQALEERELVRPLEAPARELEPTPRPIDDRASRGHRLRRLLVVADAAALVIAVAVAELYGLTAGYGDTSLFKDAVLVAVALPSWALLVHVHGLYHAGRRAEYDLADEVGPILQVATMWTWLAFVALEVTRVAHVPPAQAFVFWVAVFLAMIVSRAAVRARARRQGGYQQKTLVVGSGPQVRTMVAKILRHPEYGVNVVGCVDFSAGREGVRSLPGTVQALRAENEGELLELIAENDIQRVIVAWNAQHAEERLDLVHDLSNLNIQVDLVPSWFDVLGLKLDLQEMEGTPLLTVPYTSLTRSAEILKRTFDLMFTTFALVLLVPMFIAIAVAIKLDSRGPVFFRQQRVGKDDRRFMMLKFRSMSAGAEARKEELAEMNFHGGGLENGLFKIKDDPRVTRVGAWLRRSSLDELPQLINVLRGDMTLVGPRPLIESEARQVAGRFRRRLSLPPGITGLWQVVGRSEIPFEQMVSLDYLYATSWSIWGDLRIILRTFSAVFGRRGAY